MRPTCRRTTSLTRCASGVPSRRRVHRPSAFVEVYQRLALDGADEIVSVHLSGAMSATVESAQLAAKEVAVPVRVVDSRSIGMGLGFPVLAAAQAAESGADAARVEEIARERSASASVLFYVDTLEYLRRGGRIGKAAALVGSALSVKPLLHLVDGNVAPLEKVRTTSRALSRLEEIALERVGEGAADVAVQHLANPDKAHRARGPHPGTRAVVPLPSRLARSVPSSERMSGPG